MVNIFVIISSYFHLDCLTTIPVVPLAKQVAGNGTRGKNELGFLQRQDKKLLKQAVKKEMNFYQQITTSNDLDDTRILPYIPEFLGVQQIGFNKGSKTMHEYFLILSDITEIYILPNVIDIKIGFRTWGPDTSIEKRIYKESKNTATRDAFGYIVKGMMVNSFNGNGDENNSTTTRRYNKTFGESLTPENARKIPQTFFDTNVSNYAPECAAVVLEKIRDIYSTFLKQRKYNFTGSSLLIAYDANAVKDLRNEVIDSQQFNKFIDVKIIDFGNVYLSNGQRDDNFLIGLKNLIDLFECFLEDVETKHT